MTPDGWWLVDIHALTHTNLGYNHRGKRIRYKATAHFTRSFEASGETYEGTADFYPEHLAKLIDAGWKFDYPNNGERVDFDPPIPVTLDENRKLKEIRGKPVQEVQQT